MAAIIALIGLPLMLSNSATWLISRIVSRLMRLLLAKGSTCECLEWSHIPDGPLRENNPKPTRRHPHDQNETPYFDHDSQQCLDSTLGKVFQKAWTSPQQRNRRVFKPLQLSARKRYVRIDEKVLMAYFLLTRASPKHVQFEEIDGVQTLHLTAHNAQLHFRTKHEIDMILQGYPPFYLAKIDVSDTVVVDSPISSYDDIARAGWIVAIALDSHRTPPLKTHNMEDGCEVPKSWEQWTGQMRRPPNWLFTTMVNSVKRFGQVLENLQTAFPDDERVQCALQIFSDLITGEYDVSNTEPQKRLRLYPSLGNDEYYQTRDYRLALRKDQWELAMSAFNPLGPLTQEAKDLFRDFMVPILQAAMVGLLHVFMYEHYRNRPSRARQLETFPQVQAHRYIYLTYCELVEHG
jgi:hypothetical protein